MAKFELLLPEIRAEVPGAMDITIVANIRKAAIDFCDRTRVYRINHDVIKTSGTLMEYDLDPPSKTVVSDIIWVTYDGDNAINPKELIAKTDEGIRPYTQLSRSTYTCYYSWPSSKVISVAPQPVAGNNLELRVALKPTPTATSIDDDIYNEWSEAFYHGALARLHNQPDKDWSDASAGAYHQQEYEFLIHRAKEGADRANLRMPSVVQYGGI